MKKIGVLWEKKTKNGDDMMSGTLTIDGDTRRVFLFLNHKEKDTHPDWGIFDPDQDEEEQEVPF